jgi:hypothetical protein
MTDVMSEVLHINVEEKKNSIAFVLLWTLYIRSISETENISVPGATEIMD